MNDTVQWFYDRAGYSYDPKTETPEQGRERAAEILALAEAWAEFAGLEYQWSDDWDVGSHQEFYGEAYDDEPETCEQVYVEGPRGTFASLGCIDGADQDYRRVIEAELAYELMPSPVTIAAQLAGVGL